MNKFATLIENSISERYYSSNRYDDYSEDLFDALLMTNLMSPTRAAEHSSALLGAAILLAADMHLPDTAFVGNNTPMAWANHVENNPVQELTPQQISGLKRANKVIIGNIMVVSDYERNMFDAELRDKINKFITVIRTS